MGLFYALSQSTFEFSRLMYNQLCRRYFQNNSSKSMTIAWPIWKKNDPTALGEYVDHLSTQMQHTQIYTRMYRREHWLHAPE